MTASPKQITLSIREVDAAQHRFEYHVLIDGDVVASNRSLSPAQSQAVRDVAHNFGALFEQRLAPRLALDTQQQIGE